MICMHNGCSENATYGIENVTCPKHYIICHICNETAYLFSPAGQLCRTHTDQAKAIEMDGAYPSNRAIRAIIHGARKP
jgi:hypothetical protein